MRVLDFLGGASGKEPACHCRRCKRHGFNPWIGKIPWKRAWQPIAVFLPGESHRQRSLVGYSPWGNKELDRTDVTLAGMHSHLPFISKIRSDQSSVVSDSLRPHESQHARPPCPSPLPEFTETHVHRVSDAIQPSHPLSSPSPPAPNPSQHQSLFQ